MIHPLLSRQLRKAGVSAEVPPTDAPAWHNLLDAIHRAYTQADQDRSLLERSLELSSAEMRELYNTLTRHNDHLERVVAERTAELEAARARDRIRLDELETLVQDRTAELRHAALHDKLTGLPNRALFHDRLHQAIQRRRRIEDLRFSVLFIDFDRFKVVNDSLGHEYGDRLLRAIAERITSALRVTDTVCRPEESQVTAARLGGDEFCVLLEELKRDTDASIVASRLLAELSRPYSLGDTSVVVTASIGITHSSLGYQSAEDMLRDADIAMYRAKHLGKAQFVVFDRAMHRMAMRRLVMENDIRLAIEREQLYVVYQPIVSLETGRVLGAEALCRWRHPEYGEIPPADFIPLAEETDAIAPIGEWVLRTAVAQFDRWRREPNARNLEYISVNVSPGQLLRDSFLRLVCEIIEDGLIEPGALLLEITETMLMQNPDVAKETIRVIRELGISVYLDDFGSGYSSLGLLHDFRLDGVKLDRRFLESASSARRAAACIHAVVSLGQSLSMGVIAEGIESLEQVALLQSIGCERGQGYLFSRPVAPDELPFLIEQIAVTGASTAL